jgi:alkanesulfonate monooxygenase SsuD/methylene tetrahydromethanopterin reductase-like flavin-dependent oxidoreductase (luciferase family)
MSMRSRQDDSGDELEGTDIEYEIPASSHPVEDARDEVEEMEGAAQLLEITNEFELDQFIGGLLQKAARTIGSSIPASVLEPLAHTLKGALKRMLPIVGGSSRATIASMGSDAARSVAAANAFGLELEGLSPEDQEFELARRFVRLTRAAGRRAPRFSRRVSPRVAVRRTLVTAARRHAPGLLRRRRRFRRFRRGSRIMVPTWCTLSRSRIP